MWIMGGKVPCRTAFRSIATWIFKLVDPLTSYIASCDPSHGNGRSDFACTLRTTGKMPKMHESDSEAVSLSTTLLILGRIFFFLLFPSVSVFVTGFC